MHTGYTQLLQFTIFDEAICRQTRTEEGKTTQKGEESKKEANTDLLTVVLCELVEESGSLLGLKISQHGSDDGADVF